MKAKPKTKPVVKKAPAKDYRTKYSHPWAPTKYKPEYCDMMFRYFDDSAKQPYHKEEMSSSESARWSSITEKFRPTDFPTMEKFCVMIDVDDYTLTNRCDTHSEFFAMYKKCQKIQKDLLLKNGLNGLYSPNFAIFVGTNLFKELKNKSTVEEEKDKEWIKAVDDMSPDEIDKELKDLKSRKEKLLSKK